MNLTQLSEMTLKEICKYTIDLEHKLKYANSSNYKLKKELEKLKSKEGGDN